MFLGEYQHQVDPKGRVIMPAKFRGDLQEGLVVVKGLEKCLFVFPLGEWKSLNGRTKELGLSMKDARAFVRFMYSSASQNTLDAQGRVMIPQPLRDYAGLKKDIVIIGVGDRAEIWEKEAWAAYNKQAESAYEDAAEHLAELGF